MFLFEGIRNIGFVHSPLLGVADNTETDALVHVTDWMPTFMHIASNAHVDGSALGIDGIDQFTTLTGGADSRDVRSPLGFDHSVTLELSIICK